MEAMEGSHNELNNWVRTEQGGPILGLRLVLSPAEQELYRQEHVDLASLPDRSAFISSLRELRADLMREIEESGGQNDAPRG